jgi:hypothetical protein
MFEHQDIAADLRVLFEKEAARRALDVDDALIIGIGETKEGIDTECGS